uniref:Uncharacterized protein n=1 Tax=Opuntia streptacantha TaxID=393608 RepID=A0A7C9E7J6_OPUST
MKERRTTMSPAPESHLMILFLSQMVHRCTYLLVNQDIFILYFCISKGKGPLQLSRREHLNFNIIDSSDWAVIRQLKLRSSISQQFYSFPKRENAVTPCWCTSSSLRILSVILIRIHLILVSWWKI